MKLIIAINFLLLISTIFSNNLLKTISTGGSVCAVESYEKVPFEGKGTISEKFGDLSRELALGKLGVKKTTYTYDVHIDGKMGIFYSDCSCFVGFVVHQISAEHFNEIPKDDCVKPPAARANMWSGYFAEGKAAKGESKHWKGIRKVADAKHGDVLSWGFIVNKKTCQIEGGHKDTGHVMFIVKGPEGEEPVTVEKGYSSGLGS